MLHKIFQNEQLNILFMYHNTRDWKVGLTLPINIGNENWKLHNFVNFLNKHFDLIYQILIKFQIYQYYITPIKSVLYIKIKFKYNIVY